MYDALRSRSLYAEYEAGVTIELVLDLDDTLYPESTYVVQGFWWVAQRVVQLSGSVGSGAVFAVLKERWQSGSCSAFQDVIDALALSVSVSDMAAWYRTATRYLPLYPDVPAALRELRRAGHRMSIVTNGPAAVQRLKVESLGVASLVDRVVIADDYGRDYWKPARALWEILDLAPGSCVVVGNGDDDAEFAAVGSVPFIDVVRSGAVHHLRKEYGGYPTVTSLKGIALRLQEVLT
jgi:putative hydrolase of the HAD superfamily